MKPWQHPAFIRLMGKIRSQPIPLSLGAFFVIFTLIYLVSKHEDQKTITYEHASDFSNARVLSSNQELYKRKEQLVSGKLETLEKQLKELTERLETQEKNKVAEVKNPIEPPPPVPEALEASPPNVSFTPPPRELHAQYPQNPAAYPPNMAAPYPTAAPMGFQPQAQLPRLPPPSIISFPVKSKSEKPSNLTVQIPAGSFVKAKLLTGIEAPEGKAFPVLMQADYAFVGPNKSRVDLSGCFLIAKSTGNLSIERVEMQTSKLSCVSKSGRMFERDISGYVADGKDNSFAVMGDVNSKQDRVAATAFLASIVQGISGAVSQAQTTTTAGALGGGTTSVTGDQAQYIAANGAGGAASTVTQWYLKHAESLLPTINVGSGQDVWVIMQDSVSLPNWYFEVHPTKNGGFSFLSNLMK